MDLEVANVGERRRPMSLHGNSDSETTMASSAAEELRQQWLSRQPAPQTASNSQTLASIGGNKTVHIGQAIHHHYYDTIEENSAYGDSTSSKEDKFASENFGGAREFFRGANRRRNIAILVVVVVVILVVVATTITTVVLFAGNTDDDGDDNSTTTRMTTTTTSTTATTSTPMPDTNFLEYFASREQWNATEPKTDGKSLPQPIRRIIVAETGGDFCSDESSCAARVKAIQDENSDLDDIPYNFLVGGDGRMYEGRGFEVEGQHTANQHASEFNSIGICVAFIGSYAARPPSDDQMRVFADFLSHFTRAGNVSEDYIVVLQDDLIYRKVPSRELNLAVGNVTNYYPLQKIYRREEWQARSPSTVLGRFSRVMDWVMLTHTASNPCNDVTSCSSYIRSLQNYQMNSWSDIGFNFMIGGDGFVYEGRGWDNIGVIWSGSNHLVVAIGMIGDFTSVEPSQGMLNALIRLMDEAEALGKLTFDFVVSGRQEQPGGAGPGNAFMVHVRTWCRYKFRAAPCD